ncbi:MAG: hypothetical protein H0U22_16455, partial [Geodermatophilaceae bacterium]|nr:hypothetical protein [Geodermatophilaceae bacterium]
MSALTKVFVVLHVVLTMLFVAATIVFVNRVEEFKKNEESKTREVTIANRRAQFAEDHAKTAIAEATAVKLQTGNEVSRIRQLYNT